MTTLSCLLILTGFVSLPFLVIGGAAAPDLAPRVLRAIKERRFWTSFWGALGRALDPVVERLVHLKPLPAWTNAPLAGLVILIWAYAIGLNWWADSRIFTVGGLVVIGAWFVGVFALVEGEQA